MASGDYLRDKTYEEVFGIEKAKRIKKKMSQAKIGIQWKREDIERRRKSNVGQHRTKEQKERMSEGQKGKVLTIETKNKISESCKGRIPWNKNIPRSKATKEKISKALKGKKREYKKGKRLTKEHIKKCLRRRTPSSLERKFQSIIDKHNLPYRYTGDGKFFIERCNPDFINTNNEKIAIEVYARFYKRIDNRNIEKWKRKRSKVFNKYGWKIIYFDETQVNEENITKMLKGQING